MVPAGIGVAVAAALAFEGAYLLQVLEARQVPPGVRPAGGLVRLVRRRRWLAGVALTGIGAVLQVVALRLAPLTVVQPTLALGVVALVAVGGRVLGEPVAGADIVAALVLAGGVTLLGLAGAHIDSAPAAGVATAVVLLLLALPVACALVLPHPLAGMLLAGAAAGDVVAALALKRLADALGVDSAVAVAGWLALAAAAGAGALASEMASLRHWPGTRVGPFVLVCQTAVPVLLAPIVAGERWGAGTPAVLAGLVLVAGGCVWLAISARRLEDREAFEQDVGRLRQGEP
jgi:hypothetical protein